jgi:hypothetical protein
MIITSINETFMDTMICASITILMSNKEQFRPLFFSNFSEGFSTVISYLFFCLNVALPFYMIYIAKKFHGSFKRDKDFYE